jgi:hypothetical protein
MSLNQSGQDKSGANSQQEKPSRKRHHVSKREAAFVKTALAAYALLIIAGGSVLFDPHSTPAILAYIAAAIVIVGGVTIHYRHIFRNKRTLALKVIFPLVALHACALFGTLITKGNSSDGTLKPQIEVTPRGITNFFPGNETGIGMTYRSSAANQATAYAATSSVQVFVAPFPLPADYPMPTKPTAFESKGMLAPGGELDGFGHTISPLTAAELDAIADGKSTRIYVAGTLSYQLVSGQICERNFLWETGGPDFINALRAFESDHQTKPPFWEGDRFNDLTPACR